MNPIKKFFLIAKSKNIKAAFSQAIYHIRWLHQVKTVKVKLPTKKQLVYESKICFDKYIKISILTPVFNTNKKQLKEMIESVLKQSYQNWELCLADGSDLNHFYVEKICKEYAHKDSRVLYQKLKNNAGISANTNECAKMATGDYIGLLDHDDILHPSALFEVMESINNKKADVVYSDEITFKRNISKACLTNFKPDFAPDTLRSNNYICHFLVFKKSLFSLVNGFDSSCDGAQDFDLILKLAEKASNIVHIPQILYFWRASKISTASGIGAKPYVINAGCKAVENHLHRVGLNGTVSSIKDLNYYKIDYEIIGNPKVSIIVPNKDHKEDLEKCLNSVYGKSTYTNFEIIIVENNSTEQETFDYYKELEDQHSNLRVVNFEGSFNYSSINNFGVGFASGEYLVLLNNDTEVITPNWIEEMLMYCQRPDIGVVGAKLYYPDNTIQHAGVVIGLAGFAGHIFHGASQQDLGYNGNLIHVQNLSAVTAACMMIKKKVFDELYGLNEKYVVAFNDIDFCLRVREKGYLIVWTPFAELYHYESKSRGLEDTKEKIERFEKEIQLFQKDWNQILEEGDPYYNPNLSYERPDSSYSRKKC